MAPTLKRYLESRLGRSEKTTVRIYSGFSSKQVDSFIFYRDLDRNAVAGLIKDYYGSLAYRCDLERVYTFSRDLRFCHGDGRSAFIKVTSLDSILMVNLSEI